MLFISAGDKSMTWTASCLQRGLRVFVASNGTQPPGPGAFAAEGWAVVEDDEPLRAAGQPDASRAALAPFLALRELGPSFKWAFAGTRNADTLFFPRAAAALVKGLDPDVPYLLTGAAQTPLL